MTQLSNKLILSRSKMEKLYTMETSLYTHTLFKCFMQTISRTYQSIAIYFYYSHECSSCNRFVHIEATNCIYSTFNILLSTIYVILQCFVIVFMIFSGTTDSVIIKHFFVFSI